MAASIFTIAVMVAVFVYMWNRAAFRVTRQLALVPLAIAGVEALMAGVISGLFPVLTVLLVMLRLVVLACCVLAMRADRAMARERARRRAEARRARMEPVAPGKKRATCSDGCCA